MFGAAKLALLRTSETSADDDVFLLTETPGCALLSPTPDDVVAGVSQIVER
jgi:hypothetical protein